MVSDTQLRRTVSTQVWAVPSVLTSPRVGKGSFSSWRPGEGGCGDTGAKGLTSLGAHRCSFLCAFLVTHGCGRGLGFVCASSGYRDMSGLGQEVRSAPGCTESQMGQTGAQRGHAGQGRGEGRRGRGESWPWPEVPGPLLTHSWRQENSSVMKLIEMRCWVRNLKAIYRGKKAEPWRRRSGAGALGRRG